MWSWYYGDQEPGSKVIIPQTRRHVPASDDDGIDLTDAMNPDWYFREHGAVKNGGMASLRSPGHIKQVGFGRNKVDFVDVLHSNGNSRRI